MFSPTCEAARDVLRDPSSKSDQRWHSYRVLLESLEPQQHIWCRHSDFAKFLCGLLEFPGSELWKRFQTLLNSMSCQACVTVWSNSVNQFLERLPKRFEDYSIDILQSHMIDADAIRLQLIEPIDAIFEIIRRVYLVRDSRLNRLICSFLEEHAYTSLGRTAVILDNGEFSPIIYLFCMHPRSVVRSWCQSLVRASQSNDVSSANTLIGILDEVVTIMSKECFQEIVSEQHGECFLYSVPEFWSGLNFLLNIASEGSYTILSKKLLTSKSGIFIQRLLSHSGLAVFNGKGSVADLPEKGFEDVLSPTLSCLSWFLLNTPQIFWENNQAIGRAVFADMLRKAIMFATRSLEALSRTAFLASKVIDILPIFIMSLPREERPNYIGSSIRFLLQVVSNFVSDSQKVVLSLQIHVWSACFKIIRCPLMMNSNQAVLLCSDAWAESALSFACSNGCHSSTRFLENCSTSIRTTLSSEAIETLKVVLRHELDTVKKISTDESDRVFISESLWLTFSAKCKSFDIPDPLLEIIICGIFNSVLHPPSFIALGFDRTDGVMQAYNSVRTSSLNVLGSLSSQPHRIRKLLSIDDKIVGLGLLLISCRDFTSVISDLLRHEVMNSLGLKEKPNSVNDCLSLLYHQKSSLISAVFMEFMKFCTKSTVFHCIEKLVKTVGKSSQAAGFFLADLFPCIFWLDRILRLFSDRSAVDTTFESIDIDSLWKLFFILIVSCIEFYILPEFERVFSALFDMGITLLALKPAFLTSFREFLKSWLLKRELIPSGTRRRWFQFVRSYIRTFPDEKEAARSVFNKYHGDTLWLYQQGLADKAQKNYLESLAPSVSSELERHQSSQIQSSLGTDNGSKSLLANLPALSSDCRRRDIGAPHKHTVISSVSGSTRRMPFETEVSSRTISSMPVGLSRSVSNIGNGPRTSLFDSNYSKTSRFHAGFQSLRDDPELFKHANLIKNISVKPLTTVKTSSDLKRRQGVSKANTSFSAVSSSVLTVDKLPVKSLGHFLNIILDWSLADVIGDELPKNLSSLMVDPLPRRFDSFLEYRKAFGPLLLEETRAMIQNDYESNRDLMPVVAVKQGLDTTPHHSLPGSLVLCSTTDLPDNLRLSESDLLLVWAVSNDCDRFSVASDAGFGIVDGQSNSSRLLIRMTRCPITDPRYANQLMFLRVSSLVTAQRMARSLESVARLRLGPALILGQPDAGSLDESFDSEDPTISSLNSSQKSAVTHCICSKEPVVLLQGPPGTGKSTVIVALIKALLQKSMNKNSTSLGQGWRKNTELDSRHILLCTPSNAAADELTSRLVTANIQAIPESTQYPVIRYGSNVTSDPNAESVSLDRLASASLSSQIRPGSQLDGNHSVPTGADRRSVQELREKLLSEANVLVCTLSGSGASQIGNIQHSFQVVIVDEAAQAHEIETLIPLQYSCRKLILVGDPRQLPATVLSTYAGKFGLNRSMFERLETVFNPVMLTEQYRMHPDICQFPSKQFYQGRVITANINRSVPIHGSQFTRPYLFFDVPSEDVMVNFSRKNVNEAQFVANLLRHLERTVALYGMTRPSIGVITPYQAQVHEIRYQASSILKQSPDVRTIDSFQGQERDIIVFSAVRASEKPKNSTKGLGFVADGRRLNVALTRAKLCCLIVGSANTLSESISVWQELISNAKERNCFISVSRNNYAEFLLQSNGVPKKRLDHEQPVRMSPLKKSKSMVVDRAPPIPRIPPQIGIPKLPIRTHIERPSVSRNLNHRPLPRPGRPRREGLPPSRRPRAPQIHRPRVAPNPDAIRRLASQTSSQVEKVLTVSQSTSSVSMAATIANTTPGICEKSTASLGLDDILSAM